MSKLGAYLTASNLTNMKGSPENYPFLWNWHGMSGYLTTQGLDRAERVSGLGQEGDEPGAVGAPNGPDDLGAAVNEANEQQLVTTVDDITDAAIETDVAVQEGAVNYAENQNAGGYKGSPTAQEIETYGLISSDGVWVSSTGYIWTSAGWIIPQAVTANGNGNGALEKATPWLFLGGIAAGLWLVVPMLKKRGTRKGMVRKTARRAYEGLS